MATKKVYYVAEGQQEMQDEASLLPCSNDQLPDEAEAGEPRCGVCNELLAWHEQACNAFTPAATTSPLVKSAAHAYAYGLGHLVQPVRQEQAHIIIWRGQLKERHPQTGLIHRVNVYRLNDNFWDCYHEDDLQAA